MASKSTENISKRRSSDVINVLFYETYAEVSEYVRKKKLPDGQYVLGRMLALCHLPKPGIPILNRNDASKIVAEELRQNWIDKNVYPAETRTVSKKIQDDYEKLRELRKTKGNITKPKTEAWCKKASDFNERMTLWAYDVRAKNEAYQN